MRSVALPFLLAASLGAALASCSFTAGSGFTECRVDLDCGGRAACVQGYCIPLPERCERREGSWDTPERIPLVALVPLTLSLDGGAADDAKVAGLKAMELAVGEVNAAQGLDGRRFALFACDTGADDTELQRQTAFFVSQLGAPVLITTTSSQTTAAFEEPHRQDAGTLVLSATATGANLVDIFKADPLHTLWRVAPPDTLQVRVLATLLKDDPMFAGSSRVAIVYQNDVYGQGLASPLRTAVADGGREATTIPFTSLLNSETTTTAINALVKAQPNVTVMVARPADVVTLVEAIVNRGTVDLLRASGHKWLFTDLAKSPALWTSKTSSQLYGMYGTAPAQGAGPAFQDFRDRYQARFHVDPSTYAYVGHFYDATYLAMLSCAWAKAHGGLTGPNLAEGMEHLTGSGLPQVSLGQINWDKGRTALAAGQGIDVEGASGRLDFDLVAGAPSAPYQVWQLGADGGISAYKNMQP